MKDSCKSCRFWMPSARSEDAAEDEHGNEIPPEKAFKAFGECRREAPRISEFMASMCFQRPTYNEHVEPEEAARLHARFDATIKPVTWWEDWCGHFERGKPGATPEEAPWPC